MINRLLKWRRTSQGQIDLPSSTRPLSYLRAAPIHALHPHTRGAAAKVKVFVEFLGEELRAAYRWEGLGRAGRESST